MLTKYFTVCHCRVLKVSQDLLGSKERRVSLASEEEHLDHLENLDHL